MAISHQGVAPGTEFEVLTKTYLSQIRFLTRDIIRMERTHIFPVARTLIDAFASQWNLGLVDPARGQLKVRSGNRKIPLEGPIGVLLPSFSLVEWTIAPGLLRWTCFTGNEPLPRPLARPHFFSWNRCQPATREAVLAVALEQKNTTEIVMERFPEVTNPSNTSGALIKKLIDTRFKEDCKIQDIGDELQLDRSILSREFKRTYGISMIDYRTRLRLFEAIRLMGLGYDITDAVYDSGFSNPGQFIGHFKELLGTTPSEYKVGRTGRVVQPQC
ncbi:MAG: helix-turn-helix transcriptional regulator [Deltaproteobacteria bacterium]|jgi:AraC-like DNA-binding protein|nr:helix-turn-helix transcriptional regulator [Deltaproteobacteria bacterium]